MEKSTNDLESVFHEAATAIRESDTNVDTNTMLRLYGLYKQATQGTCSIPKPGFLQFTARSKWDAWNNLGSMTKDEAMSKYAELVHQVIGAAEGSSAPQSVSMMGVSVSCLARTDPLVDDKDKTVFDWLKEGVVDRVELCIKTSSCIVNQPDDDGMRLIHWAADRGDVAMLRLLLANGADVNAVDWTGQTPLHYTYACGHDECVELLLQSGADPRIRDADGNLPIDLIEP